MREVKQCSKCVQIAEHYNTSRYCCECTKENQKQRDEYLKSEEYLKKKAMTEAELEEFARKYNSEHPWEWGLMRERLRMIKRGA